MKPLVVPRPGGGLWGVARCIGRMDYAGLERRLRGFVDAGKRVVVTKKGVDVVREGRR